MTVAKVQNPRAMSEVVRLAKNKSIAETQKKTRARRASQLCRVYDLKVAANRLNRAQAEALKMVFVEAKWIHNAAIAYPDGVAAYVPGATVSVRNKDKEFEERPFRFLGSQMKQSVVTGLKSSIKALAAAKDKGCKVGALGFTSRVASLDLKQYGNTYKFKADAPHRVKVQNIPGWLTVHGTGQFTDEHEFANAKLVQRADGYHLLVTTYIAKTSPRVVAAANDFAPGTMLGVDMGVKTHLTLSDGTKVDALFGETDRLKRLQRKLSRQTKGSNNWVRTKNLIRKEYEKISRRKDDCANKLVHEILRNEKVFIQDENISSWKMRDGYVRGGRRIHSSILGRVKAKLVAHERVTVIDRYTATTQTCLCGRKTRHTLEQRTYVCQFCAFTDDRDVHAAKNMIRFGLMLDRVIPVDRRECTRVETYTRCEAGMDFSFIPGEQGSMKHEASRSLVST